MGNTAKQCRLGLSQDSDFAGDLEDSKSTSDGILSILGSHTFVPTSWMCKKQTSVSHSSTEAEIIFLTQAYGWMVSHFGSSEFGKRSLSVHLDMRTMVSPTL